MTIAYPFATSEPVNQQIYRLLRQEIVDCTIRPGTLLSEKEISTRFNVSRQPVREAFIKLSETGLVQILPQRGTFVMKISAKRVSDGRFIREAVEIAIIRRAALAITPEHLMQLKHNLHRQELAASNKRIKEFLELDDEFHRTFTQIVDCPMAWETIETIKATMDRVRFMSLADVSPPESLIEQHYKIYDGLEKRDPDAAEAAMKQHLGEMISTVTTISQRNTDWFEADE
ncbi:GntR family transcriptional regulator [Budviciaceae bacterium CWB-B4]|uniref:GntR family transcriptional regulator n=1 Tax=Limnobaculum xujianqingii TaxID=2738837 RepID=A0A9D7AKM9_9GAMM|nr:GntR family transcriptional regulator [Limnobaculum xujianqingii]MBK5074336.1 GntR family transcriptional regulator [Limnobaculum xujianqingii]MBK5177645.1 GntR family transcriptional regulator [Limnobaculum xujianqingii]